MQHRDDPASRGGRGLGGAHGDDRTVTRGSHAGRCRSTTARGHGHRAGHAIRVPRRTRARQSEAGGLQEATDVRHNGHLSQVGSVEGKWVGGSAGNGGVKRRGEFTKRRREKENRRA